MTKQGIQEKYLLFYPHQSSLQNSIANRIETSFCSFSTCLHAIFVFLGKAEATRALHFHSIKTTASKIKLVGQEPSEFLKPSMDIKTHLCWLWACFLMLGLLWGCKFNLWGITCWVGRGRKISSYSFSGGYHRPSIFNKVFRKW